MRVLRSIVFVFFFLLLITALLQSFAAFNKDKIETWFTPLIWLGLIYVLIRIFIRFRKNK